MPLEKQKFCVNTGKKIFIPTEVEVGEEGILEEVRFDLGFGGWMGILKVNIGQIDISDRRNILQLLYSKYIFKNFIQSHLLHYGQALLSLFLR